MGQVVIHYCLDIQLDGGSSTEGWVEFCYDNEWKSVCDDYWTDIDANVACKQLSHPDFGTFICKSIISPISIS